MIADGNRGASTIIGSSASRAVMIKARILLVAGLALLAGCAGRQAGPPAAPSAVRTGGTLKLADWNMEFLAAEDLSGCRPRKAADYAASRRVVEAIDADVFAFEEVENEVAAARVFDPSRYVIVMERRPGRPGGSCGGEHPGQTFIRQAVGFAIRKGLPFDRGSDLTALQIGNPNLRSGVEITVRPPGGEPLRLLVVHLKSGCFQGEVGQACPEILGQMPIMKAWIQAAAAEGTRFAVMGDWNRRLALPNDLFWATIDTSDPPDADLVLTDAGVTPRCDPRYRDFIDHIVLDRRAGGQFSRFAETTFPKGQHPSDHCPISLDLRR